MAMQLYELVNGRGQSLSPYVWRIRCALHQKQLSWSSVTMGFTEPRPGFPTFPTLRDGELLISDSWAIAQHLEARYPAGGSLFGPGADPLPARFIADWVDSQLLPAVFRVVLADLHDSLRPEDQAYYRETREKRVNGGLETTQAQFRSLGSPVKTLLEPARRQFAREPFLSGSVPRYPDYCLHSLFHWARLASDFELLESDDPVSAWLTRMDDWASKA